MSLFDDVKKNLVEWYSISSVKTAEVAKVTTRRYDKFGISRDIERQFSELGSLVFNGLKDGRGDLLEDPSLVALVERINGLENELNLKNEEIELIQKEYGEKRHRAAAEGAAVETEVEEAEIIITQPILDEGSEEAAILVEPVVVDVEDGDIADGADPEK